MNYMFAPGFFGTRAPFFMDLMILVIALLPFALYLGIFWARKGLYDLHRWYQWLLFCVAVLVVGWFEYGVRAGGGFSRYAQLTDLPAWLLIGFLLLHVLIAVLTLYWWVRTLLKAERNWRSRNLPGGYSLRHIRNGWRTAWGIFLTSLTGVWVYLLLFLL
jgi:putative membrane protein